MTIKTKGCFTAMITPMKNDRTIDRDSLCSLVEFQIKNGVSGLLAAGTTGESATLNWKEHLDVIKMIKDNSGRIPVMAGTGSNSTEESIRGTSEAFELGADMALLVDPYYNAPSSIEIRRHYLLPVASAVPDMTIIPYIIPGRTTTMLRPADLALAKDECPNIAGVKEATGNIENMKLTRRLCGDNFMIFSGDDALTGKIMSDENILACGTISVMSNIFPKAVSMHSEYILDGRQKEAEKIEECLKPLFECITVKTIEYTKYGDVEAKFRNPVPVKTLMNVLGIPSGPCREPLGKLTKSAINIVIEAAKKTYENAPSLFSPVEDFYGVDVERRLNETEFMEGLYYGSY